MVKEMSSSIFFSISHPPASYANITDNYHAPSFSAYNWHVSSIDRDKDEWDDEKLQEPPLRLPFVFLTPFLLFRFDFRVSFPDMILSFLLPLIIIIIPRITITIPCCESEPKPISMCNRQQQEQQLNKCVSLYHSLCLSVVQSTMSTHAFIQLSIVFLNYFL